MSELIQWFTHFNRYNVSFGFRLNIMYWNFDGYDGSSASSSDKFPHKLPHVFEIINMEFWMFPHLAKSDLNIGIQELGVSILVLTSLRPLCHFLL